MRDLVDIVVIARTQRFQLVDLRSAIVQERLHRALPSREAFRPPDSWRTTYPQAASATRWCDDLDFDVAGDIASRLLDPAMAGTLDDATWDPAAMRWQPPLGDAQA